VGDGQNRLARRSWGRSVERKRQNQRARRLSIVGLPQADAKVFSGYPIHVVCAWLGNSTVIANEHYLQVTEAHYEQAAQIPAQSAAKTACQDGPPATAENEKVHDCKGLQAWTSFDNSVVYPQGDSKQVRKRLRRRKILLKALQNPVQFYLIS
jgi:hypothetical protein